MYIYYIIQKNIFTKIFHDYIYYLQIVLFSISDRSAFLGRRSGCLPSTTNYPKKIGFNLYQSRHCAYITYSLKTWFLKNVSVYNYIQLVSWKRFLLMTTKQSLGNGFLETQGMWSWHVQDAKCTMQC